MRRSAMNTVMVLSISAVTAAAVLLSFLPACGGAAGPEEEGIDRRQEMRQLVTDIAEYSRGLSPGFIIVLQNGQELLTEDGEPEGPLCQPYASSIDGQGREDLYFGYDEDDVPTPPDETDWMVSFLDLAEQNGVEVLVTDYCWTTQHVDSSYAWNQSRGYTSFAADSRDLDRIPAYPPQPWNHDGDPVTALSEAGNFLYLIDDGQYSSVSEFVGQLSATDYDLFILDLFCCGESLDRDDLALLGVKPNGQPRLVLCYVSIGEAEDYRWYWDPEWETDPPSWLGPENPQWPGNYLVEYWDPEWAAILYGSDSSYVDMVVTAGFDGVYLDKIDSFEDYEQATF